MKRVFALFALLCLLCQLSLAGPVDQSLALKIASNFFGQGTTTHQLSMSYKAPYKTSHSGKVEENMYLCMTLIIKDNIILCEIFQMPNWHSL